MAGNDQRQALAAPPARRSVRYRVAAGLAIIIVGFTVLTVYSIILHRRTVAKVEIINSAYLPLTLGVADMHATQKVFNTMMDRLPDDPNRSATRDWLNAARRYRPSALRQLITIVHRGQRHDIPKTDAQFLKRIRRDLMKVSWRYTKNEHGFQKLDNLMDTGRLDEARLHIEGLKRVERALDRVLAKLGDEVGQHITLLADEAEYDGYRATWGLGLLTGAVLIIAGVIIISINKLLVPLKSLLTAVGKVAQGDLSAQIDIGRKDEIGAVAQGFNNMTQALAERDEMLIRSERLATAGKMAAQVTHEIRNPLSSLGLNAELLEEEIENPSDKTEAKALLKAMQDEVERLTGITESYLRYARLPPPKPQIEDLNAIVQAAIDFMKNEIKDQAISVEPSLAPALPPVLLDRGQIRQAFVNLLRNACDAMPDGGTIRATTRTRNDTVEIEVADSGHGISDDALDQIFESFYTSKSGGTGLGLPLVRQICLAHGGSVRCEDSGEHGSTFVMALPTSDTRDKLTDINRQQTKLEERST